MKSKIHVDIHKDGFLNLMILRAIGKHNGETNIIDREILTGYILGQRIEYPASVKDLKIVNDGDTQHISEDDGKTFTLSLSWNVVHKLEPENDIPSELFQSPGAADDYKEPANDYL